MAQHRAPRQAVGPRWRIGPRWLMLAVGVGTVLAVVVAGGLLVRRSDHVGAPSSSPAPQCGRTVRVVTATSFEPVLARVGQALDRGADCLALVVETVDGRAAPEAVQRTGADVWIPDDVSWTGMAQAAKLAAEPEGAAGSVLATSPIYMVTDEATAQRVRTAGGSWLGLAKLVADRDGPRLAVRDPAGSGDGMVGLGSVAEAVWLDRDMDASALWLARAKETTRTVQGLAPALPERPGEVGVVPEYALLRTSPSGSPATVLAGADRTALLRYSWQPTAAALADPARAAALQRLLAELQGPGGLAALAAAHLRAPADSVSQEESDWPGGSPAPAESASAGAPNAGVPNAVPPNAGAPDAAAPTAGAPDAPVPAESAVPAGSPVPSEPAGLPADSPAPMPPLSARSFLPLKPHHVDHVFASWYPADRRTSLLVVVDVSGSMTDPAPGTKTPLMELVRQGCRTVVGLLPDDAQLGLWEFGVDLAGDADHRPLVNMGPLAPAQREAWSAAVDRLAARRTGTGLYDTILAAYTTGRDNYRPGMPNQVLILTDGRNQDDPDSLSAQRLAAKLAEAKDPTRPVQLSVATFGQRPEAERLRAAVQPVDGHLDSLTTPEEVAAVFIHTTAGGLHR